MSKAKISAFVICYNRADILPTCLQALSFADELIVVDKSSTDASARIAACYAHQVVTVPWTPTVEETRTLALSLCRHDWILFLDDDECLNAEAGRWIRSEVQRPRADIYALPLRHYILGTHDERAYYWPEHHVRLFRRGSVSFSRTVHAGVRRESERVMTVWPEDGVCIHHLSHQDAATWLEKTNRYTSRRDRARGAPRPDGFAAFAHDRIDHWMGRTTDPDPNGYPAAVALLRAVYDMIDAVKAWEEDRGVSGRDLFEQVCRALQQRSAIDSEQSVVFPDASEPCSTNLSLPPGPPDWLDAEALLPSVPGAHAGLETAASSGC